MYVLLCLAVFGLGYLANMLMITVGYHRGLAHRSVHLSPFARKLVIHGGSWVTGLDPKSWAVMHRMHHAYSDTAQDPHSPSNVGLVGILFAQVRSYHRTMERLQAGDPEYTRFAMDLDFGHAWVHKRGVRALPYVLHGGIALAIALGFDATLLGVAYFVGLMSHPIQGGLVNSLGHAIGGRNFETDDDSTNNALVAWLVFGEGYQNNHHAFPRSAKFSFRPWEIDPGFAACVVLESFGLLRIDMPRLIPADGKLPVLPEPVEPVVH